MSTGSSSDKPKRTQVKNACTNCQRACKKCDEQRPCGRCVRYGLNDCTDSERKKRITGAKRGPYRKRERVVTPSDQAAGEEVPSEPATTSTPTPGAAGSSTSIDTSQQTPAAVMSFPMFFAPTNGTQGVPAGLFAVYGYSTNGIPLGPDGQPIQFGTTYPVPIGYIPATIPVTCSATSPPGSPQAATPEPGGNGEDLNECEPGSTVNTSPSGAAHATNRVDDRETVGYENPDYSQGYRGSPQMTVAYSDQDSSFSPSYPITFSSMSPIVSTSPYDNNSQSTTDSPINLPPTRKRKLADEVAAVVFNTTLREDHPSQSKKKATKAELTALHIPSGDLRVPLLRPVAVPPSDLE